jgi:hypothetical protein
MSSNEAGDLGIIWVSQNADSYMHPGDKILELLKQTFSSVVQDEAYFKVTVCVSAHDQKRS